MVSTQCDFCGGTLHWDWTEAFTKFGFNDGDGQVETWQVEAVLGKLIHLKSTGVSLLAGYVVSVCAIASMSSRNPG